jgi:hypothetical protein
LGGRTHPPATSLRPAAGRSRPPGRNSPRTSWTHGRGWAALRRRPHAE